MAQELIRDFRAGGRLVTEAGFSPCMGYSEKIRTKVAGLKTSGKCGFIPEAFLTSKDRAISEIANLALHRLGDF